MRKILGIVATSLLFSCTYVERDNPYDSGGKKYMVDKLVPSGCKNAGSSYSCSMKSYRTVEINGQVWMAENLNCDVKGSYCHSNETENCNKFGRLYDWCTAMAVCPRSWHLPSNAEWQELVDFAGGSFVAGKYLKADNGWYQWDWYDNGNGSGNGEDTYKFSALPGGEGPGGGLHYNGIWWSSTELETLGSNAYFWGMSSRDDGVSGGAGVDKGNLYSVRCLKD